MTDSLQEPKGLFVCAEFQTERGPYYCVKLEKPNYSIWMDSRIRTKGKSLKRFWRKIGAA